MNLRSQETGLDEFSQVPEHPHASMTFSGTSKTGGGIVSSDSSKSPGARKPFNFSNFSGSKNEYSKLKSDFVLEMKQLSKLRHPCITTVMGAVIGSGIELMLVMEFMDHGSLHDILQNETMIFDGEILIPIFRDIAQQGVRFLHTATPQLVHSALKASNILVDSRFRAKVADFGLSQRKKVGAAGTPYWLAPEVLRGETSNTAESDAYAFGMIIWEVYSRKNPYEWEDPRRAQISCQQGSK
jgi:guanylate cyclase